MFDVNVGSWNWKWQASSKVKSKPTTDNNKVSNKATAIHISLQ